LEIPNTGLGSSKYRIREFQIHDKGVPNTGLWSSKYRIRELQIQD